MIGELQKWWHTYEIKVSAIFPTVSFVATTLSSWEMIERTTEGHRSPLEQYCITSSSPLCIENVMVCIHRMGLTSSWWYYECEMFSKLLALCEGIHWLRVVSSHKRPIIQSFTMLDSALDNWNFRTYHAYWLCASLIVFTSFQIQLLFISIWQ